MSNRNISRNGFGNNDAATVTGIVAIAFVIFAIVVAIQVTAIVFAVINGIALFGPDGDISSVWHWVWFVICGMVILGGIFSRASK